ncbi:YolD-like protein [Lentibacillus halodurans]|uniref:YolD-like protein n=1 Tax=Lentibacillus halodurans TaxID=237679 RepID=A0A1I0VFH8_9BACI|nr:YolD-like family protein [Lentibacillus halodurans]SFA74783.1 YolD-like protein [Lentibacillus halodurans]
MPRDRGSIKWSSLMLPEHVELLKEMWQHDGKTLKPTVDEQQTALLDDQLLEAFELQSPVCLRIYENGGITERTGMIKKLDSQTNSILLKISDQSNKRIAFHDILSLTFI